MAQIPRYLGKEKLTGGALPKWQPGQARRPFMAQAEIGKAVTEAGSVILKVEKKKQAARDQILLSQMKMETIKMVSDSHNDPDVMAADSKTHDNTLNKKILEGRRRIAGLSGGNANVLGAWTEYMNIKHGEAHAYGNTVGHEKFKNETAFFLSDLEKGYTEEAIENDYKFPENFVALDTEYQGFVDKGIITAEKAQEAIDAWVDKTQKEKALRFIEKYPERWNNPHTVIKIDRDGKKHSYERPPERDFYDQESTMTTRDGRNLTKPSINEFTLGELDRKADTEWRRNLADMEKYQNLKEKLEKQHQKEMWDGNYIDQMQKIQKGDGNIDDLNDLANNREIRKTDFATLQNAILNQQLNGPEDTDIKDSLYADVYNGNVVTPNDILDAFSKGDINQKTMKDLQEKRKSYEFTKTPEYGRAKEMVLKYHTGGGLTWSVDLNKNKELMADLASLYEFCATHPKGSTEGANEFYDWYVKNRGVELYSPIIDEGKKKPEEQEDEYESVLTDRDRRKAKAMDELIERQGIGELTDRQRARNEMRLRGMK